MPLVAIVAHWMTDWPIVPPVTAAGGTAQSSVFGSGTSSSVLPSGADGEVLGGGAIATVVHPDN